MINKILLILLTIFLVAQSNAQNNIVRIYVAPNGKEGAPGSLQHQLNKLSSAIKKGKDIVARPVTHLASVEIYLRGGVYGIDNTVELVEGRTWTSTVPLTITGYNDENVVLHGGKVLPENLLEKVADTAFAKRLLPQFAAKIRQINLARAGIENTGKLHSTGFSQPFAAAPLELFLNGQPGRVARWPNHGSILIDRLIDSGSIPRRGDTTKLGGTFTYAGTDRPSKWKDPAKAWLYGFFMWGYADETVPLKTIDIITKTITTALPSMYGFGTGKPWRSWYAYNLPEEIDTTGEYYVDEDKKLLYFLPPDTITSIEVSILEAPVIALEGAKNVAIKNITITCSRGMGLYMERARGVRIKGCTFSNLSMMGISMGKGIEPFTEGQQPVSGRPASRIVGNLVQYVYENTTYDPQAGFDNGIIDCHVF
ncbi:MAG: right-handed parallel beta-helix repeat-containing protein, partial [Segetibacter sp.]